MMRLTKKSLCHWAICIALITMPVIAFSATKSVTLRDDSTRAFDNIASTDRGVVLFSGGASQVFKWEQVRPESLPEDLRMLHREDIVIQLKKAEALLDSKDYLNALDAYAKVKGHLAYLLPADLAESWGKDAARKVSGELPVEDSWMDKDAIRLHLGWGMVKGEWLSPENYKQYRTAQKMIAQENERQTALEDMEKRQAMEAESQWAAQTAELRRKAFSDSESMTRYLKLMMGRPWMYTHSHGTVSITGNVRLGDVSVGDLHTYIDFMLVIGSSKGRTSQSSRLKLTKDFDGWHLDEATTENTSPLTGSETWDLLKNYSWGRAYVNYLLFGK